MRSYKWPAKCGHLYCLTPNILFRPAATPKSDSRTARLRCLLRCEPFRKRYAGREPRRVQLERDPQDTRPEPHHSGSTPHAAAREPHRRREGARLVWENLLGWNRSALERGARSGLSGGQACAFASHPSFPYDWETEHGYDLRGSGSWPALSIRLRFTPPVYPAGSSQPGIIAQPRRAAYAPASRPHR